MWVSQDLLVHIVGNGYTMSISAITRHTKYLKYDHGIRENFRTARRYVGPVTISQRLHLI
jgi:hypothetical protein